MAFIDDTYFVGERFIPNLGFDGDTTNIDRLLTNYQEDILTKLLGYSLYKLLIADLDDGEPQTQRFKDLVNGAEFENVGTITQTLKWNGFKNTQKLSLIADYTYYKYLEQNATKMSGVGNTLPQAKNSERVSPIVKMVNAWYDMRKLYGIIPEIYRNHFDCPHEGSELSVLDNNPSAYNFLIANKDTYPEWIFTPIWSVNQFGI